MPIVDRFPLPPEVTRTVPTSGARAFGAPRRGPPPHPHAGVDLFAPVGTVIRSPVDGQVVRTLDNALDERGRERACGFGVLIESSDGYRWLLCHMNAMPSVERGEHVEAGDALGVVGTSGNAREDGPHLHIEAKNHEGVPIDVTAALADALARDRGAAPPRSTVQVARPRTPPIRRRSLVDALRGSGALTALALTAAGAFIIYGGRRRQRS